MEALQIENTQESLKITFDKSFFKSDYLLDLLTQIRTEYLVQQADFDESIEDLGEEIKRDWWSKNKQQLVGE